jgi:hypothetical protein
MVNALRDRPTARPRLVCQLLFGQSPDGVLDELTGHVQVSEKVGSIPIDNRFGSDSSDSDEQ